MLSFRGNDSDKPDSLIRRRTDSGVEEAWRALKKRAWIEACRKEMGLDRTE